jgi:hypothetical protein
MLKDEAYLYVSALTGRDIDLSKHKSECSFPSWNWEAKTTPGQGQVIFCFVAEADERGPGT